MGFMREDVVMLLFCELLNKPSHLMSLFSECPGAIYYIIYIYIASGLAQDYSAVEADIAKTLTCLLLACG